MNNPLQPKKLLHKLVPRKNHFIGIDIGTHSIKVVETKIYNSDVEVVSQHSYPSVPGVWTDKFDEEALVAAMSQGVGPLNEVVSCIGGEKVIMRSSRFPLMNDRELASAVQMEIAKYLPASTGQAEIRFVRLDQNEGADASGPADTDSLESSGQSVLLLGVPSATVYQYYSIFSRAGMTVTAFDLQAFALWRVFGRDIDGTAAIIDIGEKSSQFVVVKDGAIRFIRLLPVGGITLTRVITSAFSVESAQAERLKEESSVAQDSEIYKQGGSAQRISGVLREGLTELIREVNRSLNFYATQERQSVERIILSGGTSKLNGITDYCQEKLGIKAEIGVAQTGLPWQGFDPAYAVALGLAMRGIEA